MKAAVWHGRRDIRVENVVRTMMPEPGQVMIEVKWCGICGSDLHEYEAGPVGIVTKEPHPLTGRMAPLVLGHEFSGEVSKVGEGVKGINKGERVVASPLWWCGECYWCHRGQYNLCRNAATLGNSADGAFAEYVNVPANTVYKLPPAISYETGTSVEPLAVAIHAVKRGNIKLGDTIAIWGAGAIGLFVLQASKAAGAARVYVIEVSPKRKDCAITMGATAVLDPNEVNIVREIYRLTDGVGVDVALECVGAKVTGEQIVRIARRGGKVVIVGVYNETCELDLNRIGVTEREVIGSFANNGEFESAIAFLSDGRIKSEPMISQKIKLNDIVSKGFEELVAHKERNIRILVSPE